MKKRQSLATQKKKHLRSVTLIFVGISNNKLKILRKRSELLTQLDSATKKEMKLPKSDEDIEEWSKNYPDVAAIVETIAMKKASEQSSCS